MDAFNEELNAFKERIQTRAEARIEAAMKEVEEVRQGRTPCVRSHLKFFINSNYWASKLHC